MGSVLRQCKVCDASFFVDPCDLKHRPCRTCSSKCAGTLRAKEGVLAGANNSRWRGGITPAQATRDYHARRKIDGLCRKCDNKIYAGSEVFCELCLEKHMGKSKERYHKAKIEAFNHYGRTCVCCGQLFDDVFLTLNHANNDGAEHRREVKGARQIYYWARKNGYPTILETNCWNCNGARMVNKGICPCLKEVVHA